MILRNVFIASLAATQTALMVWLIGAGYRSDTAYASFGLSLLVFSLLTHSLRGIVKTTEPVRVMGFLLFLVWLANYCIWQLWPGDEILQFVIDCSVCFFLFELAGKKQALKNIARITLVMIGVQLVRFIMAGDDYPYQVAVNFLFIIQCTAMNWLLLNYYIGQKTKPPQNDTVVLFRSQHGRRAA